MRFPHMLERLPNGLSRVMQLPIDVSNWSLICRLRFQMGLLSETCLAFAPTLARTALSPSVLPLQYSFASKNIMTEGNR